MSAEFPNERIEAEEVGNETAEGLIARAEELLNDGLFDREEREEVTRILRTARLLTQNLETRKEIDCLLADIENRYGKAE